MRADRINVDPGFEKSLYDSCFAFSTGPEKRIAAKFVSFIDISAIAVAQENFDSFKVSTSSSPK